MSGSEGSEQDTGRIGPMDLDVEQTLLLAAVVKDFDRRFGVIETILDHMQRRSDQQAARLRHLEHCVGVVATAAQLDGEQQEQKQQGRATNT
jgi:hypothetical protein